MNTNIIPYVPIAPRVQATNPKSELLCRQLFSLIDRAVSAQFSFNHDTSTGKLSLCPDQINDLIREISQHEKFKDQQIDQKLNIEILRPAFEDLIYPKFNGEFEITSSIWNSTKVTVWQFQLNQIAREINMKNLNDAELNLDMTLSAIRIWRNSLESQGNSKDVTYQSTDLIYKLMDMEQKLQVVQKSIEE
ncbi:hypothetical protein F4V57_03810 [Acinetobacter qingfengensis]|uniref:Uncharacterized protein n=1 Tax=Acinetobacter qingfengensis TaxID=1262585 RepID=A0A1E7RCJ3_9GAMM|nr:hypothetical protein [Acinetobacter qingfengensis]KAA8734894.1 hypothetical protein F4V57_03810 [Acinetobacter qingfengensis]OEY96937.1 hypothetical protein BJI46_11685 [Acinetobacter qingfengensis]